MICARSAVFTPWNILGYIRFTSSMIKLRRADGNIWGMHLFRMQINRHPNVALKLNTSDHRGSETPDKLGEEEQK